MAFVSIKPPPLNEKNLPDELWLKICSHLNHFQIKQLRMTSKYLSVILREHVVFNSKLCITPKRYERIRTGILNSEHNWPFHTIDIKNTHEDQDLNRVLKKCSDNLHCLRIYNSLAFLWLSTTPLPFLEELEIVFTTLPSRPLMVPKPKKWNLRMYEKLHTITLRFPSTCYPLYRFFLRHMIKAGPAIPLQKLSLSYFVRMDKWAIRIFKTHMDTLDILELEFAIPPLTVVLKRGDRVYNNLRRLKIRPRNGLENDI